MMTRIYLLRHGATAVNREIPYRLQGSRTDLPLDEVGIEEACSTRNALAYFPVSEIYCSPLLRAVQTAAIIGDPHVLEPIPVAGLAEGDVGRWEGLTWSQAAAQDPEHHARFMRDPGTVPYPDGESFLDVQKRATAAITEIIRNGLEASRIVIVGHNILNRAFLAPLLGLPIEKARGIKLSNCGISVLDGDPEGNFSLLTLNSTLHLDPSRRV